MADRPDPILHTSQLGERMRRGDAVATRGDRVRKVLLDTLVLAILGLLVAVVAARVGLLPWGIGIQTVALAGATAALAGASFLFTSIHWRALRGARGEKILHRAKADLTLTTVSILALFTVFAMGVIEVLALLVFTGVITRVGAAGAALAGNFVLFQTIMLLVYLLAIVAREAHESAHEASSRASTLAAVLTPLALVTVAAGAVLATGVVSVAGIEVGQAVYVVTLGVLFEFVAMRIRLRLPTVGTQFMAAVETARRANEEIRDELRRKAQRTYVAAIAFVTLSMAFAGAVASGAVSLGGTRLTVSLVIFYAGTSLILLALVAVRVFQARHLKERESVAGEDELAALVSQKRRSPEEVFRQAVYVVTGLLAAVALVMTVLTALDRLPWHRKYSTDLFILAVLFGAGPFGYFYNREAKRILAIDEKFPDFLRDLAESARAGMTLPRALVTAGQGTYGALTDEVQRMAAQVEWGVSFADSLQGFAQRTRTPLIDRTVSLVIEAQRAGGNVVDILTAASEDAREIKQIISERNTQMSMYNVVIYIAFFVFIAVVLVLVAQFIPAFKEAVGAASGAQVGGLTFRDFDPEDFNALFFRAALVQAIGGGLVGGVLTRGTPVAGFMHIGIMMAVSWLCFRVIVGLM